METTIDKGKTFQIVQSGHLSTLKVGGKTTPHWKRPPAEGMFRGTFSINSGHELLELDISEWDSETPYIKRVVVELNPEQAKALYELLKGRFE